jgi:hypothetical protein
MQKRRGHAHGAFSRWCAKNPFSPKRRVDCKRFNTVF